MNDMDAVTEAKSDQINADDLLGGKMLTATIDSVVVRPGTEQPITVHLVGHDKVFRPCKTVARVMKAAWGLNSKEYVGRQLQLWRDPDVTWAGIKVGGLRIRAISHIDSPLVLALQENKKSKKMTTIQPLQVQRQVASADALTLDAARDLIEQAPDMDALGAVWKRKTMAPFRAELQDALDKRKGELAPPSEEQFAGVGEA